jgi:hypothetical protein
MNQLGSTSDDLGSEHSTIRRRRLLFRDIALGARRPDQLDPIGDIDGWHIYEASIADNRCDPEALHRGPESPNSRRRLL